MNERDIYIEAVKRPDPAEREAYLDAACAGDAAMRRRIELLLAADREASAVLRAPAPPDATSQLTPPTRTLTSSEPSMPGVAGGSEPLPDGVTLNESFDVDGPLAIAGLSQFDLLAELGRGGMGVVYKARHRRLNRIVALKMIRDSKHASPETHKRFLIEAEAVARLRHPNIVEIYDFGEAEDYPFVTLEMLEGGSLADRLKGTTQPGRAAAELVATLARAMHEAHRAGIVHRDLKPANVLFDRDSRPKITDFGLAKRLEVDEGHTRTGQIMGTPSYMAPEQAQGLTHQIGPPADIYALGAILYELLTGRPPFKSSSMMETLHQVVYNDVVPPSRIEPRIARDLETICLKCLQKEPQRRYGTALELADDLYRYLDNRPIRARRTPLWERGVKWVRRRPATATLLALATAAAVVLAVLGWNDRQELDRRRAASEKEIEKAQARLLGGDWDEGRFILGILVTDLKQESRLDDIRGRAERLLEQSERKLADAAEKRRAQERQHDFVLHRDEAFLHESRFSNLDLPVDVSKTRAAARAALAVFALSGTGDAWTFPPLPRTLTPHERAQIADECYELLLVLAEAVAEALPGEDPVRQADRSLRILDQASGLRSQPTRAWHRARAACLALKRDQDGAARERAAADRLRPATVLDHFLAGREGFQRQDWKTAFEEFEAVLRKQPGHFWALCLSAMASLQTNQPGSAKLGLSACIERQPEFAWLHALHGLASGQQALQARTAGKTLKIEDGSIEAAVEAQFDSAEADFRQALELLDRNPNDEVRWIALIDRALIRFHRGWLDQSVADLEEAIRLNERHYNAFASLAQVLQRQKKWDEADARFTRAIALKPGLAALYRGRAAVRLERDDPSPAHRAAALRDLEDAIRYEKPGNPVVARDHVRRGELLRREQRFEDALGACDAALKAAPDFDMAHRLRVLVLLDLDRPDKVIASCDGALAQGKPWPDIHEIRGLARANRRDFLGAIEDYSHALVLHPGQPRVLSSRGLAYLLCDAPRLALHDFDEALRREPSNGEAHSGRGWALVQLGDHRAAVAEAEESLRLDPPTARRARNAARIYALAAAAAAAEVTRSGQLAVTLVDRYQDRAVALVKLALERTPAGRRAAYWQDQVVDDPALRSLQRRLRALQPAGVTNHPETGQTGRTLSATPNVYR
jgi:serine/threonine protein kinase/predicted Zn-dependent protease